MRRLLLVDVVLILHILAEAVAGAIMAIDPSVFVPEAGFSHLEAMRGFGNGAISVTLLGALLLSRRCCRRPLLLFLTFFKL